MRVAVVVEQVWDAASIEVDPGGAIDWSRAVDVAGPGSLEALELALALGETAAYGLGVGAVDGLLRRCLALGAGRVARAPDVPALAEALRDERADLVLAPHRSGDGGAGLLGPALAGLLDLPQATAVETLRVEAREVVCVRRLDRGEREELALPLPAVVAVEPGLARPREASPRALIAAQSAEVPVLPAVTTGPRAVLCGHAPPRPAPRRLPAPPPDVPAEARIAAVVGGTMVGHRALATGTAEEVADRIVRLLEERGYL